MERWAQKAAKALIAYAETALKKWCNQEKFDFVDAKAEPKWKEANELLHQNSFAYLLAVIYDQGQPFRPAWRFPWLLQERVGKEKQDWKLTPESIREMDLIELDRFFGLRPRLRFWRVASARTLRAAERVIHDYEGEAFRIWKEGSPGPKEIERRLREFDGIGQKKASMVTNALYRELRWVEFSKDQLSEIDVSYDRHVRRVFLRSGICDEDTEQAVIAAARAANPGYPGILDLPAWFVGRDRCHSVGPDCENCPIADSCAQRTTYTVDA